MNLREVIEISLSVKDFMEKDAQSYPRVKHLYPHSYEPERRVSRIKVQCR